jgi:DNA-binding MarR family transcriptional regulator
MTKYPGLTMDDVARLLHLVIQFAEKDGCTPAQAIERLSNLVLANVIGRTSEQPTIAVWADRVRNMRMRRNDLFGAPLFRDPAWDMLLELYVAEQNDRDVPISSLSYASGVSLSTAARHVAELEKHHLVRRDRDEQDQRRAVVRPTAKALAAIESAASIIFQEMRKVEPRGPSLPHTAPENDI